MSFNFVQESSISRLINWNKGSRHSLVDLSAPSIQLPRVRVPSTPSMLFQIVYLSFELECDKNKNKQKDAGIGPFFNKLKYSET